MEFLFGKKVNVGLDLGGHALKWAAIEVRKGVCHVWSGQVFPERISQKDGMPDDQLQSRLITLIKTCQSEEPVWGKSVSACLQGRSVIGGYLEMAVTADKQLKSGVTGSIARDLPWPAEEVELICQPVAALSGDAKTAVYYAAMHKPMVERLRRWLKAAGLEAVHLETPALALAREFSNNHTPDAEAFQCLIHVGFHWTHVVLVRAGFPYFHREIPVAGAHFTYAFQMGEQVDWATAEQHKRAYDVSGGREHYIEPFLGKWLNEIQRSLEFFKNKYKQARVEFAMLSGGGGAWTGLDSRLEEALRFPVLQDGWDRLKPQAVRPDTDAMIHKISLGLALRNA